MFQEEDLSASNINKKGSLLLEPRSLLILQDDAYHKFLHGIDMKETDVIDESFYNLKLTNSSIGDCLKREKRISLTIRNVPKILKLRLFK